MQLAQPKHTLKPRHCHKQGHSLVWVACSVIHSIVTLKVCNNMPPASKPQAYSNSFASDAMNFNSRNQAQHSTGRFERKVLES
jgi:hypothetical protein